MKNQKKNSDKRFEFGILILITIFSLIFWESPIIYPIKLFVIFTHEISHAMMAILTGGSVSSVKFSTDLSGYTIVSGGNVILIAFAGYLGSLLIGSGFYLSSNHEKFSKWFTSIVAAVILLSAVNLVEGGVEKFLGVVVSIIVFSVPRFFNSTFSNYFLRILGLISCLYIISDIKQDLLTTTLRETDTQILEYLLEVPALLIGFVWFIISIGVVILLLRKDYFSSN